MESLQVNVRVLEGGIHALEFHGEIDVYNSANVKDALARLLDDGNARVVVNLEQVRYIDSTGLGAMLEGFEKFKRKQGSMVIVCTHPRIVRIFKITGLDNIMRVFQNEQEALAVLAKAPVPPLPPS